MNIVTSMVSIKKMALALHVCCTCLTSPFHKVIQSKTVVVTCTSLPKLGAALPRAQPQHLLSYIYTWLASGFTVSHSLYPLSSFLCLYLPNGNWRCKYCMFWSFSSFSIFRNDMLYCTHWWNSHAFRKRDNRKSYILHAYITWVCKYITSMYKMLYKSDSPGETTKAKQELSIRIN